MLIKNSIGKSALEYVLSSTSASKFEFLELPIGTGNTQFEYKFTHDTNLYHALTFIVDARSNLYPRNINVYNTGI